jgi:hypothetical protein
MVKKIRSEFQSRSEEEDSPVSRCCDFVKGTMSLDQAANYTISVKYLQEKAFAYIFYI